MMMLSKSKPGAVGTSRSQPDGEVYPLSVSVNQKPGFLPRVGRISYQHTLIRVISPPQKHSSRRLLFFLRRVRAIQNT
jgi:hypothetical protein